MPPTRPLNRSHPPNHVPVTSGVPETSNVINPFVWAHSVWTIVVLGEVLKNVPCGSPGAQGSSGGPWYSWGLLVGAQGVTGASQRSLAWGVPRGCLGFSGDPWGV